MRTPYRPILECLEDRLAPATHVWTGADVGKFGYLWSVAGNWTGGVPTTGESGGTIVQFDSGSTSIDNIVGLVIDQLHFTGDGNSIAGFGRARLGINWYGVSQIIGIVNDTGNNTVQASLPMSLVAPGGEADDTVVVSVSSGQLTLASAIGGSAGLSIQVIVDSSLVFAGPDANTYTGDTFFLAGTLVLNKSAGKAATAGSVFVGSIGNGPPAVLQSLQDSQIGPAIGVTINPKGYLDLNGHNDTIGSLTMNGGKVTTGVGKLTLNGDVVADSSAGVLAGIGGNLDLGTATRTFTVNNVGGGVVQLNIGAVISGAAGVGLIKTGAGTLFLEGIADNTYSGTTTVNDGILKLDNSDMSLAAKISIPAALVVGDGQGGQATAVVSSLRSDQIASTAALTINSDGQLDLGQQVARVASLNMTGGFVTGQAGFFGGALLLGGNLTATSDGAGNAASIQPNLFLQGATRTFTVNSGQGNLQLDISGVISNGGLTKAGAGTLRLSGNAMANNYAGATTVDTGTLVLNNSKGVAVPGDLFIGSANGPAGVALVQLIGANQINPASVVQIQNAGRLDLNGLAQTIAQLNLLGTSFGFAQTTTADAGGSHTSYTFTIDGAATVTNAATVLGKVSVTGAGGSNTAILITNDTYKDSNGATQETRESIALGSLADPGVGTLQKFDQSGNPFTFLSLSNFATSYAYVGRNDGTVQLYASTGVPYNGFVSAGNYSYIAGQGLFHEAQGAPFVYGYSAGQASDFAFHYAADAGSSFVVSGTAFSYLSANDTVNGVTQSYFNVGVGFLVNTGVAKNPGKDFAYIIDSPGIDTFVGGTAYSFMFATGAGGNFTEFDAAYGFALIFGQSFVGSADTASNSDPTKNILVGFRLT